MEDDDVEFGGVKADEGDVGRERDRHTERCDLDLKWILHSGGFGWVISISWLQEKTRLSKL